MASRSFTVLLMLLLVSQPVATAFAGCMQKDSSEHAGHNGHAMGGEQMMPHSDTHQSEEGEKYKGCFTDCQCASTCLHACHTVSFIIFDNLVNFDKQNSSYFVTYYSSLPGYKFLLLRPPAVIS